MLTPPPRGVKCLGSKIFAVKQRREKKLMSVKSAEQITRHLRKRTEKFVGRITGFYVWSDLSLEIIFVSLCPVHTNGKTFENRKNNAPRQSSFGLVGLGLKRNLLQRMSGMLRRGPDTDPNERCRSVMFRIFENCSISCERGRII